MERTIIVNDIDLPQRLDVFLAGELDDWTRSQIKLQIERGGVLVNGKKVLKAGTLIKNGDIVDIDFSISSDMIYAEPENIPLDIVFEDDDIIVINKPQGMVVHPAPGSREHTLVNALLYHFGTLSNIGGTIRPGIVHRIDKDTSGLLVVAKNNFAHEKLALQIRDHTCFRHYLALLEGIVKEQSGEIRTFFGRDKKDRKKMAVLPEGKLAVTNFDVVQYYNGYTLVHFKLQTGRTHQIRVHAKYIGHPVVGDKTYGFQKQKFALSGQLLHAKKLELTHPRTGERLVFECKLPDYFEKVLEKLHKIANEK